MKISYSWLRRYLEFDLSIEELEKILTSIGLEVEGVEQIEQVPGNLKGVVVGEVVECSKHPSADRLSLTKVDIGSGPHLSIVCGAPNVAAGQKVMVATQGAQLPLPNGELFKIKRTKIRGEESLGMICAEDELGVGESHDGIMILPQETEIGIEAAHYFQLASDTVFEIGLTPNRIDAASHLGVARDLYAYLKFHNYKVNFTPPSVESFKLEQPKAGDTTASIEVLAPDGSPKYWGVTIKGVKIAPSPKWLSTLLTAIGVRPINNVVDITNFVLHETGHPLHPFDLQKIEGSKVVVRRGYPQEEFITLDGVKRTLSTEDLMICDSRRPLCMGGIFGGEESGVTWESTSLFLESAYFNPVSIRKSSKRHSLKTDASFRYERGADPSILEYALKRATLLIEEIAGGTPYGEILKFDSPLPIREPIELNFNRIATFIGKEIERQKIEEILALLDFKTLQSDSESIRVESPSYRVDVTRECDVIEEILRIYGYDAIELPQRIRSSFTPQTKPDREKIKSVASDLLVSNGFYEMLNNSLTKSDYYTNLSIYPQERLVYLQNPLSSDLNVMRQTLLFGGLESVSHNINRQNNSLKFFEFGNSYTFEPDNLQSREDKNSLKSYQESEKLALLITGSGRRAWQGRGSATNFFMLKGYIESLLKRFGVVYDNLNTAPASQELFLEGVELLLPTKGVRGESKRELSIGHFGELSPKILKPFDIKQQVWGAELDWNLLNRLFSKERIKYSDLPRYPSVTRDLALLLDLDTTYAQIRESAFECERNFLQKVALFDIYKGVKIAQDKKQYALSFTLIDRGGTLTDSRVDEIMAKLLATFEKKHGASLR
ncbi:MAG: phenylalanine--tRNA ligase subunit beta [Bacteroidales bacterium]